VVLDLSDPPHPRQTDYLTAMAAQAPWEAWRVNARRGLLVADSNGSHALAVYSVSHGLRAAAAAVQRGHAPWRRPRGLFRARTGRRST